MFNITTNRFGVVNSRIYINPNIKHNVKNIFFSDKIYIYCIYVYNKGTYKILKYVYNYKSQFIKVRYNV